MMKLLLITLAVLPIILVIASPIDTETKKASDSINAPGPASKPKEFFGNLGDMFSKFRKGGIKKGENKTAETGIDGIIGDVKKTIDGAAGEIKKTGEDVQSKFGKLFSGGTDELMKNFRGISKKTGKTNDTASAAGNPKEEDGIGSMVSNIFQMVLPESKDTRTLADLGISQE